jgi:hypothetical protein
MFSTQYFRGTHTELRPCIFALNNFTGFVPKYRVRVSLKSPDTASMTVRNNTPFSRPIFKNNDDRCAVSSAPISNTSTLSACAGSACMLNGLRQSVTSSEMMRTVRSARPMASRLQTRSM